MKLNVTRYVANEMYHECRDEQGELVRVDIMVDGGFPGVDPETLVGSIVECSHTTAYVSIAHEVRFAKPPTP